MNALIPCHAGTAAAGSVLGSHHWREEANATAVLTAKVSSSVNSIRSGVKMLALAKAVWSVDAKLRKFLDGVYKEIERVEKDPSLAKPITPDEIRAVTSKLRGISESIDGAYAKARAAGYTNRSTTGAGLNSIRVRSEELMDFVEAFELFLDSQTDSIFDKASGELARGETVDLSSFLDKPDREIKFASDAAKYMRGLDMSTRKRVANKIQELARDPMTYPNLKAAQGK